MKKLFISLALIGAVAFSSQGAFAAWEGIQSLNPLPYLSYLNPLPYFGIGENKTNFSLNPFKGFKNCDKCQVRKTECNTCTGAAAPICPNCVKTFNNQCSQCGKIPAPRIYVQQPTCPCMKNRY